MSDRLYYDVILAGGNELRLRFDDEAEANRFFKEVDSPAPQRWMLVTVVRARGTSDWHLKPHVIVAWRRAL